MYSRGKLTVVLLSFLAFLVAEPGDLALLLLLLLLAFFALALLLLLLSTTSGSKSLPSPADA
jgi:hypothetical protein